MEDGNLRLIDFERKKIIILFFFFLCMEVSEIHGNNTLAFINIFLLSVNETQLLFARIPFVGSFVGPVSNFSEEITYSFRFFLSTRALLSSCWSLKIKKETQKPNRGLWRLSESFWKYERNGKNVLLRFFRNFFHRQEYKFEQRK